MYFFLVILEKGQDGHGSHFSGAKESLDRIFVAHKSTTRRRKTLPSDEMPEPLHKKLGGTSVSGDATKHVEESSEVHQEIQKQGPTLEGE